MPILAFRLYLSVPAKEKSGAADVTNFYNHKSM